MASAALSVTTPSDREVVLTRVFDAPRQLVFDAHTKCELIKQWLLGPGGWTFAVCEFERKAGGKYRYVWRHQTSGKEMGCGGKILEFVPPERLVTTERFDEAWYIGEAVDTLLLTEASGKTTLTLTMRFESRESRDMALKSGMTGGLEQTYQRLDHLLAALAGETR